jgi:DNA polymerase III subunit beta
MKFSIQQDVLLLAINQVQKATATRIIQPILAHILIETVGQNAVRFSATDLDFAIETLVEATVQEAGKTTISAKKLQEMAVKLPKDTVQFQADATTQLARVECQQSVFDVRTLPSEEFPTIKHLIEAESFAGAFQVPLKGLRRAIQHTVFAAAGQESNNVLSGVYFKLTPEQLEMAATDGSRLARCQEIITAQGLNEAVTAIIPARTLQEFLRLTQSESDELTIHVAIRDGQIAFRTERFYMLSRLLDGQYPQYEQLIPVDYTDVVLANRDALIKSLERAAVMANERTNIVKMSFDKSQLSLAAQTPDLGDARDQLRVVYDGDQMDIAFNYKFVLDAVKAIDSEDVRLELKSGLAPTLFKPTSEDGNYLCLIMPVQVK